MVHELSDPTVLQALAGHEVYWYGGPLAALRAVRELRIGLLEPLDDWLPLLPHRFLGREIALATLSDARRLTRPAFVKPPRDKSLPAAVYADGSRLQRAGNELGPARVWDSRPLRSARIELTRSEVAWELGDVVGTAVNTATGVLRGVVAEEGAPTDARRGDDVLDRER